MHFVGIARDNHHQIVAVILHQLNQRVDGLVAEVVLHPLARQRVGLVDKQNTAQRAVDHIRHLARRLADIARNQPAAVGFNQLPLAQKAELLIDFGDQPRHGRLARAGVAGEDHVEAHVHHLEVVLLAHGAHLDEVDERAHLVLDGFKADEAVELRHQLVQRFFLLRRLLFRLSAFLGGFCRAAALLPAGDIDAPNGFLRAVIMAPRGAGHQKRAQAARVGGDEIQLVAAHIAVHIGGGVEQAAHAVNELLGGRRAVLIVHGDAAAQKQRRALRKGAVFEADVERLLRGGLTDFEDIARGHTGDIGQHIPGYFAGGLRHFQQKRLHIHIQKELDIAAAHALPVAALHKLITGLVHHPIRFAALHHLLLVHVFSFLGALPQTLRGRTMRAPAVYLPAFLFYAVFFFPSLRFTAPSLPISLAFSAGLKTNTALSGMLYVLR